MSESESELVTIQITFRPEVDFEPMYRIAPAELARMAEYWSRGEARGVFDVVDGTRAAKLMLDFTQVLFIS